MKMSGYPLFVHLVIKKYCVQSFLLPQFTPIIFLGCASILPGRKPKLKPDATLDVAALGTGLQFVPTV